MNKETFRWLFTAYLIPLIIWFLGYLSQPRNPETASILASARIRGLTIIRVPWWLAILAGRKRGNNWVEAHSFAWQMLALGMFLLITFLALFEPDHQKRVICFGIGLALFALVAAIFVTIVELRSRPK